jgi:putative flavoprotein involved in K+ transport
MTLLGRTEKFKDGKLSFNSDLEKNIADGDANYLSMLDLADAYIERNGLDLPEEPQARVQEPKAECITNPILELDVAAAGISTVIWATGFATDYSWLKVDAFDEKGKPTHQRGVSSEPGIFFLGLPWQSRRGSSFIWGVWHDAKHLADHIHTQAKYLTYQSTSAE